MDRAPDRSLWDDTLPDDERVTLTPLGGDLTADVAIVGAGLTGLWTAWYLLRRDPALRVVVIDRHTVGFGASGRNGGWCSALLPMGLAAIAARHGDAAARRMQLAMHDTVAEVARFVATQGPADCLHAGGTIDLARGAPQVERLRNELAVRRRFGLDEADVRWLERDEAMAVCRATRVDGALWNSHCATVHPLRLTHAVARAVVAAGGRIHGDTDVVEVHDRRLITTRGTVRADVVVRATEGYTCQLPGERRSLLPIYSMMIATDPLPDDLWDTIGLAGRPTFADGRHLVVYGQRTSDGRIAFGGRGAPYHFGSAIDPRFDTDGRIRELLARGLRDLFPALGDTPVTHHWGGVLAAPRDWACSARFDRSTGFATAGGYVGDGLSTTNLAGRTLAALIGGADDERDHELTRLPWVAHRSRRWEPEPLRWLGVNAGRTAAARADRHERRTGRPSRLWGGIVHALIGR